MAKFVKYILELSNWYRDWELVKEAAIIADELGFWGIAMADHYLPCRREGRCHTRFLVCSCSFSLKNEYDPCRNAGNTHSFSPTCNSCQDGCNPGHNLKRQ